MYYEINKCRICGNENLVKLIDLGKMYFTGIFPSKKDETLGQAPLELVKCEGGKDSCGLVQLLHNFDLNKLYGKHYGYRSGLNNSMVKHLGDIAKKLLSLVDLEEDDLIIDIGSNDGTLLKAYPKERLNLVGIDPIGEKFINYYPSHIELISDFFLAKDIKAKFNDKKVKIITSIAMFYDLENPIDFLHQIYEILAEDGIWLFEQSYLPEMLKKNSYDTICHEHLEYYALKQIKYMVERTGFKIIEVLFNEVNGGSFSVLVAKNNSKYIKNENLVNKILNEEKNNDIDSLSTYKKFNSNINRHRNELRDFIYNINNSGKKIFGYGASTKGNVILQYCGLSKKEIPYIAEINEEKYGHYTPGSFIPIIPEYNAKAMKPEYLIVLPWHFKKNIIKREQNYLNNGGHLCFPLPVIEVI